MLSKRILVLMFLLLFLPLVGCFPPPVNQAPILTSTPITTATVGMLYAYDVNATDPDGDTLTYSLAIKPTGMTINPANGLIKWTPAAAQIGNNSVTVKVSDGSLSITQPFTIKVSKPTPTPINQKPVIYSTPVTTATVGLTYVYDVNATDPDGDTLTYSLTTKPSGMFINSVNGLIWWVPSSVQVGNNLVTVNVSDGALSDTQSFIIKVSEPSVPPVNQAPIIVSTPVIVATVGIGYVYGVNAFDPEGDILTYSLTIKPGGMTINSATGVISWIPISAQVGNNTVKVGASDGVLSDTQSFTIVASEPSVPPKTYTITATADSGGSITPSGIVTVDEGSDKVFTITSDTVFYSIDDVLVDGSSVGAISIYVFTNVTEDHTIFATFNLEGPVYNQTKPKHYNTIQAAINEAGLGDTILVATGTYEENLIIDKSLSLLGEDKATTIIKPSGSTPVIYLQPSSGTLTNVIIKGFSLINTSSTWDGGSGIRSGYPIDGLLIEDNNIQAFNGVLLINQVFDNVTIKDCNITEIHDRGINMPADSANGLLIEHNTMTPAFSPNEVSGGIYIQNVHNATITRNTISGFEEPIATHGRGIAGSNNDFVTISDNILDKNKDGITMWVVNDIEITGNQITNSGRFGIFRLNAANSGINIKGFNLQITGNTIENSGNSGINVAEYSILTHDVEIHDNNIVGNTEFGVRADGFDGEGPPSEIVDATNNWWGGASGPFHLTLNPSGTGNAVSDNVDFKPCSDSPHF